MSGHNEELKKLREEAAHLTEFLRLSATVPAADEEAKERLDFILWQIDAFESLPPEAEDVPLPDLAGSYASDLAELRETLPLPVEHHVNEYMSASPFMTGTTAVISVYVEHVGYVGTPAAREYADRAKVALAALFEKYPRFKALRRLLEYHHMPEGTLKRLKNARKSYMAYTTGKGTATAAANDMRNLMSGVRGELEDRAFKPKENRNWRTLADKLAIGGPGGDHHRDLLLLESVESSLRNRLGPALKDRASGPLHDPDALWVGVQGFLISLLGHCSPPT
jgi:hypothetical protein